MKTLLTCLLAILLLGCSVNRPDVERQSFLIQPERVGSVAARPIAETLRIGKVSVARPFEGREFVYRRDEVRYETDFYNEFVADPADMVGEAAAGWFRRSGLFQQVFAPRAGMPAGYRLDAGVSALYVDFRNPSPIAVLNIRWRLLHDGDSGIVLDVDSDERVALSESSPRGAALAFSEALQRALAKLEAELVAARL